MTTDSSAHDSPKKKVKFRRTAEQRVAALEQSLTAARAIQKKQQRKHDTRLKATLGGSLIALSRQNPYLAVEMLGNLRSVMTKRDRDFTQKILGDWTAIANNQDPFSEDFPTR